MEGAGLFALRLNLPTSKKTATKIPTVNRYYLSVFECIAYCKEQRLPALK
jgi:hypothetical protein